MINYLATKLTEHYIKKGKIESEDREVYVYCFDIAISTFLNFSLLVIIAICTRSYIESLIFGLSFITLRNYAGGLHAKTHIGCSILLIVVIFGWILCVNNVAVLYLKYTSILFLLISVPFIVTFAPVDNVNNPLDNEQKRKYKNKCILVTIFWILVSLAFFFFKKYTYLFVISYTFLIILLSLIVQKIINKNGKLAPESKA